MVNIVLVTPKIPQNVGNIGRTCVACGATLHIIKPIPFTIDDKNLKRAGMDYWVHLDVHIWESMEDFHRVHPIDKTHFFATTKTETPYFDAPIPYKGFIYFGAEDEGLPLWLLGTHPDQCVTIPMKEEFRSLNLASSVAIITYDIVRQHFHTKGLE